MATRRTLLLTAALGLAALLGLAGPAGAAPGQDPGATFGVVETTVTTTTALDGGSTEPTTAGTQTLLEAEDAPDTSLVSESRKVMAVVASLVGVALLIAILTIRYWRSTKPVAVPAPAAEPVAASGPKTAEVETVFMPEPEVEPEPEPEVEPEAPDQPDAAKPGVSDEVPAPEPETVAAPGVRPGAAARRKALGLPDPG